MIYMHRNLIQSNRNQIIFTTFWLILNQMDIRLVPNLVCNKQNMKIKTRELRQKYSQHCILKSLRVTYTSMHMHIIYVINNNISIDNILHTVSITNKIIPTNNILHTLSWYHIRYFHGSAAVSEMDSYWL